MTLTTTAGANREVCEVAAEPAETHPSRLAALLHDELPHGHIPWHFRDLRRLVFFMVPASVGIGASWAGVSGSVVWVTQWRWLVVGIASVVCGGLGIMSWLLGGFRMVRVRQSRLLADTRAAVGLDTVEQVSPDTDLTGTGYVSGPGMTLFHLPTCQFVRGKDTSSVSSAGQPGLDPCRACLSSGVQP